MKLILILTFSITIQAKSQFAPRNNPVKSAARQPAQNVLEQKAEKSNSRDEKTKSKSNEHGGKNTKVNPSPATTPVARRALKEHEYSLDKDNKIKTFGTRLYEGLLLSENCFKRKNAKPKCSAFSKSLKKITVKAEDNTESPYHNNLGSIHCKLLGGTGLIAKSHQNNESDFCQFKDGSMVSSWSAYYHSTQGIKSKEPSK